MAKPTRPVFSFEFKLDAVQRYRAGESKVALAKELGLSSPLLLENWARQYRTEGEDGLRPKPKGRPKTSPGTARKPESEVERLRRENERLRAEVAFLGKSAGLEGRGTALRLEVLLDVAGLARSTFFYHQARLNGPDPRASLKAAITEIFTKNHGRYGHRRIHIELLNQGWTVAKKTVLKLMRSLRLVCKVRSRKRYNSYQGEQGVVAPNLLKRQFDAGAPNQKWVTDVTEFSVADRKLYLSPIMDLFDRQIISYAIGNSPNLELANASLRGALATLENGQKPFVHSDQGFQYQHNSWRTLLADAGAVQSMSRKANCYDNAVMENFFGHRKEELFHRVRFLNADVLAAALHEYIRWYNTERISTKLKGLSPVQYRAQTLAA